LCIILHHSHVLFFSCFHNKVPLKLMFCTFHVLIIGFCVPYLDLKLGLFFFVMLCSHPLEIFVFRMFDKDYIKIAKIPKLPNGNTKNFQNYIKLQSLLLCKLITPTYGLLFQSFSKQSSKP
jgi:hypothetical protein